MSSNLVLVSLSVVTISCCETWPNPNPNPNPPVTEQMLPTMGKSLTL